MTTTNDLRSQALEYRARDPAGKMQALPTKPMTARHDLALAYSPGVAFPCQEIAADPSTAAPCTMRSHRVAVITHGGRPERAWSDSEAERWPAEIISDRMRELLARQKELEADLAETPEQQKIVGLHPATLQRFEEYIGGLEKAFSQGISADTEEAAGRIRDLVSGVVATPSEDGFKLQIEGRLAELMQAPSHYPNMRVSASGDRW